MDQARVRVIYGDTDQMGVVYHANYLRYFEFARGEFFRARGGSYRALEKQGLMLPVVEAHCSYRAPARYEDLLVVHTELCELGRASLSFRYELYREDEPQRILSAGRTDHACVNKEGKPTRLPADVATLLKSLPLTPLHRS